MLDHVTMLYAVCLVLFLVEWTQELMVLKRIKTFYWLSVNSISDNNLLDLTTDHNDA